MSAVPLRARRSREPRPQRVREISGRVGWGILVWVVGIAFFLPVLWMVLTAFKPESHAPAPGGSHRGGCCDSAGSACVPARPGRLSSGDLPGRRARRARSRGCG
jgi:hypothetical protein